MHLQLEKHFMAQSTKSNSQGSNGEEGRDRVFFWVVRNEIALEA